MSNVSPLLTGGAGFDFEDGVAAIYLAALLLEGGVLGLGQYTVTQVALQRASSGAPLDDVIVTGMDVNGQEGTLHLQAKSTLHIGEGPTNTDFRDVLTKAWATIKATSFKQGRDRVGAAVGSIAQTRQKALRRMQQVAIESATAADFWTRFDAVTNQETRTVRNAFVSVIKEIDPAAADDERLWTFFKHFVVLSFDVQDTESKDAYYAIEHLKSALESTASDQGADLWRKLIDIAKDTGDAGGSIGRPGLLERLAPEFHLESARTVRADLEKLSALARAALADVRLDVSGYSVERKGIIAKISEALAACRFVQITGEPGTGKSAMLRKIAESAEREGFVFVLSENRIEGNGWLGFAAANGLTSPTPEALLAEVGAGSEPILFIDGIDRIVSKPAQQVVADILRAIAAAPACGRWRVVASVRDENIEHVRTWIPAEFLARTGIMSISVGAFDDDEVGQIAGALPALAPILNASGAVREIARRPFFLRVLAEGVARGSADAPQSEIELIEAWWARGGYDATRADARRRQQVLRSAAELGISSFGRRIDVQAFDAGALQDLIDDSVLRDVAAGLTVGFGHDVFYEWALFQAARSKGDKWLDLVRSAGEPPFFGRIAGLLSQRAFERDDGWASGLEELEKAEARSQWKRAWLIAPFSSPLFSSFQSRIDVAVKQNRERLRRLLLGFQAEKTQPNLFILGGFAGSDLDRLARLRLADQLSWPSDYVTWTRFFAWLLPQCATLDPLLVADVIPVFSAWITAFVRTPVMIPSALKRALLNWLTAIELHRRPEHWQEIVTRDRQAGWGAITDDELEQVEQSLRFQFFLATGSDAALEQEYLDHLIALGKRVRESCAFVADYISLLAVDAMPKAVDLCLKVLIDDLPEDEDRRRGGFGGSSSSPFHWDELSLEDGGAKFFPPSPAWEPFKTLFEKAPQEALRLTHGLCNHAMKAWLQLNGRDYQFGRTPLPFAVDFPWGKQTFWGNTRVYSFYRGIHGPHVLDSAVMALEQWAFSELAKGRAADEIIRDVVDGNECCAVLGIALGVAIQANCVSDVSLALVATAHLWRWDIERGKADLVSPTQNEYGFMNESKHRKMHEALAKANRMPVRQRDIRMLAMMFVIGQDERLRDAAKAAMQKLPATLPFECKEEAESANAQKYLAKEAGQWALLADPSYYHLYRTEDPEKLVVGFENPEANKPGTTARVAAAEESISWTNLAMTIEKVLNDDPAASEFSLSEAISKVKKVDVDAVLSTDADEPLITAKQAAIVGVAALAIKNYPNVTAENIEWAKTLLQKGATRPASMDEGTFPSSIILFHPSRMTAKGLMLLIERGIDERWAKETLLALMLHPLDAIYETVVASCIAVWPKDARFGWIALCLSLSLAVEKMSPDDWQDREGAAARRNAERTKKLQEALSSLEDKACPWPDAPGPPRSSGSDAETNDEEDAGPFQPPRRRARVPRDEFRHDLASRAIKHFQAELILRSSAAASRLMGLADRQLAWTIAAHPPERLNGQRVQRPTPPYEWTFTFMRWLSELCAALPPDVALSRYIKPVLEITDDDACLELLDTFVDAFICRQIHDAETLTLGVVANFQAIADRVAAADWRWDATRVNGNLTRQKHAVLKALFLVNVERADGARRFANRDWKDIAIMLPALANLIRCVASVTGALGYFLELAERSIDHYPAESLADRLIQFLEAQGRKPAALRSLSATERIAALIQTLAAREHPLTEQLRSKLLKVLDLLVELGDRRSAALLGSELFKTVRRVSA